MQITHPSRREFLKSSAKAAASSAAVGSGLARLALASDGTQSANSNERPSTRSIKKGVVYSMLPAKLSHADRFKLARDTGFDVVQAPTTPDPSIAEEIKNAAANANLRIDSVMNMDHWEYPLSSSDPAVVEKSLQGMRTSLENAKLWGSDAVLLVPAVVNAQTSYRDAWTRSQQQIRKLIPLAANAKIVIAIEEVWNKFLLSPIEMNNYIQEFHTPWIKAWFDVGNVLLYGYPQDWIRTLGKSIVKLHVKDFKRRKDGYSWVNLGDGDADWVEVRKALDEIGYSGSAIAELETGDEAYLRDLARRMDRLVLGRA
ncbi:MAG TPA: sugar phosphate isomerase/epimerase family protein [Terriglobales bacterium]|nr:sugar phosphate isomerase/epimerase family protein [Terriglobales bacterium]